MYQLPAISNDLTKSQIKIMSEHIVNELNENGRLIESADALAKMELLIKEIKSNPEWVDSLRYQVAQYGSSTITPSGTKIELAEVGVKYDFSMCDDKELEDLMKQQEYLDYLIKERQKFLKTITQQGMDIVDKNGEVYRIFPPSRTSTSSVKTTIAK